MAGTIIVDRLESDASYASSINVASPLVVSNTISLGSAAAISGNVNIDSGLLFVDAVNNRVGVGAQNPSERLTIADGNMRHFLGTSGSTINATYTANTATDVYEIRVNKIGAVGTNLALFTQTTSGSVTERMRIDSGGRVTMPFQPYFNADRSGNQTGFNAASTGDVVVVYNSTTDNLGNHFNTSTGKFTAPVAGVYAFQAGAYLNFNASQSWLVINGNRAGYADWNFGVNGAFGCGFWVVKLAANDSVGYHPYSGSETSGTIYANANHTYFRGYLLS